MRTASLSTRTALVLGLTAIFSAPSVGQDVAPQLIPELPQAVVPAATAAPAACDAAAPTAPAEPPAPPPFGGPLLQRPKLTGDWLGLRSGFRDHGITIDANVTQYYLGVVDGGLQDDYRYGGRGDLFVNVDGQKAGLWQGFFITLHAETLFGSSINRFTGTLLPVSIAQALPSPNTPVTALTGVKFTQALSENFVTFFGKINLFDDFKQPLGIGGLTDGFLNLSMIANPVLVRTVPYSAFGAGAAVLMNLQPVLSVGVYDAKSTPTVSGFDTFFENGVVILSMATLPVNPLGLPGHQTIGGTYSNRQYVALDDTPFFVVDRLRGELPPLPQETGSWSLFYQFDQALWACEGEPKRAWGVFGSAGLADGNPNPIRWAMSAGLGGASPLRRRPLDTFGLGYFYYELSDDLKQFAPRLLPMENEHGFESFYNFALTPWCRITSDFQVVNPFRSRVDTTVVGGVRVKIDF